MINIDIGHSSKKIANVCFLCQFHWFSKHFSFTNSRGISFHRNSEKVIRLNTEKPLILLFLVDSSI